MEKRRLGRTELKVAPLGLGCWAAGGPIAFRGGDAPYGYSAPREQEVLDGLRLAVEGGIRCFDTADVYGAGQSERLLGQALQGHRDQVVLCTKFGYSFDENRREMLGVKFSKKFILQACEASLRRLQTDWIDVYQVQVSPPFEYLSEWVEALTELVVRGHVRFTGWSTDDPLNAQMVSQLPEGAILQTRMNVLHQPSELCALAAKWDLGLLAAAPLGMGLLTEAGLTRTITDPQDMRSRAAGWFDTYRNGRPRPQLLQQLESIRELLTQGGRTVSQGALGWLWATHPQVVPVPGFRNVSQVQDHLKALEHGPLSNWTVQAIHDLLHSDASGSMVI